MSTWGDTKNKAQAAAVRLAALHIDDPNSAAVKRGLDAKSGLPATVIARARTMVTDSATMAGPYRVQLSVTKAALPGVAGSLSVTVRPATGRIVAAPVSLSATSPRLASATVNSSAAGAVKVSFTRHNTPASVSFRATATVASPALMMTRPRAG
ncbi:hypothetical protein [Nigerium massiliense]|uniref:hypothetical protein n=1 Tax=Nigerium massiliense TaxID=1522317 RepID=UPI0011CC6340|nr:hypothetical protein [Nigerium massiliense]